MTGKQIKMVDYNRGDYKQSEIAENDLNDRRKFINTFKKHDLINKITISTSLDQQIAQ